MHIYTCIGIQRKHVYISDISHTYTCIEIQSEMRNTEKTCIYPTYMYIYIYIHVLEYRESEMRPDWGFFEIESARWREKK